MEEWAWVDERYLVPFRGGTGLHDVPALLLGCYASCHALLGCTLRRGLLRHGEYLTRQCKHWTSVTEAGLGDTVVA